MHDWIVSRTSPIVVGRDEKIEQIILSSAYPSPLYGKFHASDSLSVRQPF